MEDSAMKHEKTYTLEAIPENAEKHLHRCPVESCGHELFLSPSRDGEKDEGTTSWRWTTSPEGEPVRELVAVRMPNSCWCGAPLPGAVAKTFDLGDVKTTRLLSAGSSVANDEPLCNLEHIAIMEELLESPFELSRPSAEGLVL
jgi:hypothetical protein